MVDVAIIGAGPYGISIASHLKARGIDFRIFGKPMRTWVAHMPKGMLLKSEGFASSLYDPDSAFTLAHYCKQKGLPYADTGLPVPLDTFTSYGLEFQKRFVPNLEEKAVTSLSRNGAGFQIQLEDDETLAARYVVAAVGLSYFAYLPPVFAKLPREFVTHSCEYGTLDHFAGREVTVVGAGSSAFDLAALLHQNGASVQLVARSSAIRFHDPPGPLPRPLRERLRYPLTGIGTSWGSYFCSNTPRLLHMAPLNVRQELVRRHLRPAPGWFIKDQVVGKVPFTLGVEITQARVERNRLNLELANIAGGEKQTLSTEHVIAATGYNVDLRRLSFLSPDLRAGIRAVEQTPKLSSKFESSVPGLYFVGASSANSWGPLMRFAFGAGYTAQRLSKHLRG